MTGFWVVFTLLAAIANMAIAVAQSSWIAAVVGIISAFCSGGLIYVWASEKNHHN